MIPNLAQVQMQNKAESLDVEASHAKLIVDAVTYALSAVQCTCPIQVASGFRDQADS